jgi:diguanylate cyclase (GGDEF)-like protein/putative nucleotidyltransferase with HDIG domain
MQRLLLAEGSRGPLLDIDARTMARRLGALFLAGGALALLWIALPHAPQANLPVIAGVGVAAVAIGAALRLGIADAWPVWSFALVMSAATVLVAVAGCAAHVYASGFLFFLLWTPPYAYLYLSRRQALAHAGLNVVAAGVVLLYLQGDGSTADTGSFNWGMWLLATGSIVATGLFARTLTRSLAALTAEHAVIARISAAVAANAPPDVIFDLVAREAHALLRVDAAGVVRRLSEDEGRLVAVAGRTALPVGSRIDLTGTATGEVLATSQAARVETSHAKLSERHPLGTHEGYLVAASAPIVLSGRPWGAISVAAFRPGVLNADAERVLYRFADCIRLAIASASSRAALERRAATDALTGLANSGAFQERLAGEVARADREGAALAVAIMDLDGFKDLNDTHGHVAGDEVLAEIGTRLRRVTRRGEIAGRIGGDEFALVLPGADLARAVRAAERCRAAIVARPLPYDAHVTISAGAYARRPGDTPDVMMRRADVALYQVKSGGKDAVAAYEDGMADAVVQPPRRNDPPAFVGIMAGLRDVVRTIDEREAPGGGHSARVADLAERIALELGWSRDRAALLREAGLVHDVGKIGVPDEVLSKPGPLTAEERANVQHHAELGARMAADVLRPEQLDWIRSHHEQPDGRGYPEGLRGVEIPDGALVLAVAECFDALTTDRHYHAARDEQAALAELRRVAGRQLDRTAVAALARILAPVPMPAAS